MSDQIAEKDAAAGSGEDQKPEFLKKGYVPEGITSLGQLEEYRKEYLIQLMMIQLN